LTTGCGSGRKTSVSKHWQNGIERNGTVPLPLGEVETHWGKHIVHRDLLAAKVKNLSLMVALKKAYNGSAKVVFLPNDFIAFPRNELSTIENLVTRNGFAVKTMDAS
jgi:hypothetical protein